MKKPIIKNWIKYWTTTIAVSGMMVMGACGDSNETAGNTVETAETEVVAPAREEVANTETEEIEAEEQPVAEAEKTGNAEFERTSARPAGNSASFGNMDQHIEEHEEVNKQIRQKLIEADEQGQSSQSNQNSQAIGSDDAMSSDQNTYDRQSNTDFNQNQESNNQESTTQGTPDNSSSLQQEDSSMNQQEGDSNASIYQQDASSSQGNPNNQSQEQQNFQREADAPQTGTVEYGTDRQGTTEMKVESDQQEISEMGNTQTSPSGTNMDTQNQGTSEMGNIQTSPSGTNMDTQNQGNMDQTQPNNSLNNEQDTNTYDRQSNTNMQEGPDAYLIILEERRAEYDTESQQAMDDINRRYNERRESMRGQINEETGAYVSPDVDPQPKQGISQVIEDVHNNLEYPQDAHAAEIEGTVFVNFVVDENGEITNANAVEDVVVPNSSMVFSTTPLDPTKFTEEEIERTKQEMKEAAIKAVKSTSGQWEPAQQNGQAVKGEVQLPVVFDIERAGAGAAGETDIVPEPTQE